MANPLYQKLRIKAKDTLLTLNAPSDFKKILSPLPPGIKIITSGKDFDQVHWFVLNKAQMEKEWSKVLKMVTGTIICWIYYPKGTSDLTRDKGWEEILKHKELTWISLISFNDTWSTFAFRLKTEADKKKEANPKVREIFDWVNPATKEVRVPDDLTAALKKNKKIGDYFHSLAFSHKKEYIEWIVTAKREETRAERIKGTIERLSRSWKNPRNL
jgi:hypothetical protein